MTDRDRTLRLRSSLAITCVGLAALSGVTACVGDDTGAPPTTDASLPDVGTADAHVPGVDAGNDSAPAVDSGSDGTIQDSSTPDTSVPVDAGDASVTCAPVASLAGFTPPAYVPAAPSVGGACLNGAVPNLYADCFLDASTYGACTGYPEAGGGDGGAVDPACLSCELTPEQTDAGAYGPVVEGVVPILNVAGCIQSQDTSDAGLGCATAIQRAWQCAEFACKATCPVTDDPSRAAYVACTQAASSGVCSSYAALAAVCIAGYQDAGTAQVCFTTPQQTAGFDLVDFFCGT